VLMSNSYTKNILIDKDQTGYCLKMCNIAVTQRPRPKWLNENMYNNIINKLMLNNFDN
jgi:hypothetical protein